MRSFFYWNAGRGDFQERCGPTWSCRSSRSPPGACPDERSRRVMGAQLSRIQDFEESDPLTCSSFARFDSRLQADRG